MSKPNIPKRHARVNKWTQKLKNEPNNKEFKIKLENAKKNLNLYV